MSARPLRVAFQGELGAFGDEAVGQLWGDGAERVPCRDFAGVAAAVADGRADRGVLPLENSLVGAIHEAQAALRAHPELVVAGETVVAVHHCLLALPGAPFAGIREVRSHPAALGQCARFLAAHPALTAVPAYDTAGAALEVAQRADPAVAAIAGRRAAARYGLEVLRGDIEDRPDNRTRFVALSRAGNA